ncbi:spherulation-specific family 4 protein [Streptomyces sp. 5.8]|uniref:spherulation-specific family 4 protein n=1 Tax=Streptomyces sp. 5.8 TaxID=3406571 RepID=UPI003BB63FA4
MTRAAKAVYAVLATLLLAAPAPAVTASASSEPVRAQAGDRTPALAPAPTPEVRPTPRAAGVRGLEIAVPAYVWANDPMLVDLTATSPAASVVVLNPGNGDSPFDAPWQARADVLRTGTTATGEQTKVLGYVHTDHGNRSIAEVKASVDNYLKTSDGSLHVDGIFFDVVSRDCGPGNATRDHYAELRTYVQDTVEDIAPGTPELVVNNPGTAIADCFLEPGRRTADVFVTFEDTYAAYTGPGWLGGNVFNALTGYRSGAELDPSGTAFWHLVHDVPDASAMRATLRTAFERGAGYAYATSAKMPNPWDAQPSWKYRTQTWYASTLG